MNSRARTLRGKSRTHGRWVVEALEDRRLLSSVWYVDAAANGGVQDGSSWGSAFTDLQQALSVATSGDQVRIAQGVYRPTSTTDRTISFQLPSGVSLFGGYAGSTGANPDARDVNAYATVLSGDIGTAGDTSDNLYHILVAMNPAAGTTLDGMTFRDAYAGPWSYSIPNQGGGIYCSGGALTINSCSFTNNTASGGGAIAFSGTNANITNSTFTSNTGLPGNYAGGAISASGSILSITNCSFNSNTSGNAGGAIASSGANGASLTLYSCTFTSNSSRAGGAIFEYTNLTAKKCTFVGNSATSGAGGAVWLDYYSSTLTSKSFTNCSFIWNKATTYGGAVQAYGSSNLAFTGCSFTGNTASSGGAVSLNLGSAGSRVFANSLFVGNVASVNGGGVQVQPFLTSGSAAPTLQVINSTFNANSANPNGGAINSTGAVNVMAANSIFWDNPQLPVTSTGGSMTFDYCDFSGTPTSNGTNLYADPQFVLMPSAGADGMWGTVDDDYGNLHLDPTSPLIDNGGNQYVSTTTDLDGNQRVVDFPNGDGSGAVVDRGAYEVQTTIYVDAHASGNNDGTTWENAFNNLQNALAQAVAGADD